MNTITESRDKIEAMKNSTATINGVALKESIRIIATDIEGSVDRNHKRFCQEKSDLEGILFDWDDTKPEDSTHQKYYREVMPNVLRLTKIAQDRDPVANV